MLFYHPTETAGYIRESASSAFPLLSSQGLDDAHKLMKNITLFSKYMYLGLFRTFLLLMASHVALLAHYPPAQAPKLTLYKYVWRPPD
jgi:hypothetical protein